VGYPPVRWRPGASSGERTRALEELARAAAALADEHAAPWRAFKEFAPSELPLARAALAPAGWLLAPSEPGSALALEGPDFATYLRSLRSPYRYRLRKAARRLEQAGVRVEVAPLAAAWEPGLHALYEAVLGRAAVQLERLTPAFFAGLGRALGERALLVSFRRDGRVIGWVAMVVEGEAAYDLFHGIDYAAGADCDLYVNQIAAAIGVATERGARAFCLGQSTEEAKARFGARPAPLWVALRHRSAALTAALRAGQGVLFPERPYPLRRAFAEPARRPAASAALRRAG
jgi:hypothetical protein